MVDKLSKARMAKSADKKVAVDAGLHGISATASRKRATEILRTGKGGSAINTPRGDMVIVRLAGSAKRQPAPQDQTVVILLPKVGKALSRPGIRRDAVFKAVSAKKVYAYSVDPTDPTRMIREDAEGHHAVGRLVNGAFKPFPVRT